MEQTESFGATLGDMLRKEWLDNAELWRGIDILEPVSWHRINKEDRRLLACERLHNGERIWLVLCIGGGKRGYYFPKVVKYGPEKPDQLLKIRKSDQTRVDIAEQHIRRRYRVVEACDGRKS
jgi:hypothetical protein